MKISATIQDGANSLSRDTLISKTISVLRWPLAVLVVIDHYFRLHLVEEVCLSCNTTQANILSTIEAVIISFFKNYPVPIFFFISGYLLYLGKGSLKGRYLTKLQKLPREILFPYIFWSVYAIGIYILFHFLYETELLKIPDSGCSIMGWCKWFVQIFIGTPWPVNIPLWYVRDLLLLILLSPLIHKILIASKGWIILFFGLLYLFLTNDNNAIRFQTGLFFFSLGYWLRYTSVDVVSLSRKLFCLSVLIYLAGGTFYFVNYDITIDNSVGMPLINCMAKNCAVAAGLIICLHIVSYLIAIGRIRVHSLLASASFFIYVTHYPLLHPVFIFWSNVFGGNEANGNFCLAIVFTSSVITAPVLTFIYFMVKKAFPTFVKVIDGR